MNKLFITTYIICGGKSSRMGSDKASFLLNKKTFLAHIIDAVSNLETDIKLVTSLSKHQKLGYKTIADLEKDKGPVCGITSALTNSSTNLNLILSCDIPFIKNNLINWLLEQHNSVFDATILCSHSKKMPLIGVYNSSCTSTFKTHLKNKQLKLMKVLDDLKVNYVEVPKNWASQIANINTQEELKLIKQ